MLKAAFATLGCKVNQADTETLIGLFKSRGYSIVDFSEEADVYVINTCCVTNLSEQKSRQIIRKAGGKNENAIIVATGCYAQNSADKVARLPKADIITGAFKRERIVDLVEEFRENKKQINLVSDISLQNEFEDIPLLFAPEKTRAFLKIQEGCVNYCAYCIIPYVRGRLRSRPLKSIFSEAERLVQSGFKEIVLTGIHLGAYGRDLNDGTELSDAARLLLDLKDLTRLRLGSLETIEASGKLIELMKNDKRFCRHLHLPLQSGDDEILKAMKRNYTTEDYRHMVERIRGDVPEIAVTTDIIAGFPGERCENFSNTLKFVESMDFARAHIFPYSRKKGTPAASYSGQISAKEKKRRAQILKELSLEKENLFVRGFLGKKMDVLFESEVRDLKKPPSKMDWQSDLPIIEGLTDNYLRIFAQGNRNYLGEIAPVEIQEIQDGKICGRILK